MKNSDMPAMPMFSSDAKPCMVSDKHGDKNNSVAASGLTKREHLAGLAMQGHIAKYGHLESTAAKECVEAADNLLRELEK